MMSMMTASHVEGQELEVESAFALSVLVSALTYVVKGVVEVGSLEHD